MKYFYINDIKFNYNLEFDYQNIKNSWKTNTPLIEYLETLGITIPHYCYHNKLSIAGNCRMCLIELKKSPKPIVSCAVTAKSSLAANSKLYTNSPLVKKARENVLEFLLLNHPLDCPICDQGGECDLQDQSFFFGISKKRFYKFKRIVTNKNLGPIVKTVMTRCIHCTRCIRFAHEIAGVESLGIYGRGISSEIGTYIDKIFQSELSGNVIDICPVGALTSKTYSFLGRGWELKNVNSIDISDAFGVDIQVLLKNNKIVKVLPGYKSNIWISNKTRFLFDGMFTPDRKILKTINSGNKHQIISNWNSVFKDIIHTIYFYDHLNRHFFKIKPITFVFDDNASLEIINILQLITKKFPIFKLRRNKSTNFCNDFETKIQIVSATDNVALKKSNACLLIGTNPRFESSYLNLKLKKRVTSGNFKIYTLKNHQDLNFPTISLGNSIKVLKSIAEGNHYVCQNFKETKNLILIINSNIYKRHDSEAIELLMKSLNLTTKNVWNNYNLLSNNLNTTGSLVLNNFKNFSFKDYYNSNLIYFVNAHSEKAKISRLTDLKLLNYVKNSTNNKSIVEQNNKERNFFTNVRKYTYLPNNVFFETNGKYINNEGLLKKKYKIISSKKNTKEDWQILRKFLQMLDKIEFLNNNYIEKRLQFNCKNFTNFDNFTNLLYLSTYCITKNLICKKNQNFGCILNNYVLKKKFFKNMLFKNYINDFYLDGSDSYSEFSNTLIDCSKFLRIEKTNFK